MYLFYLPEEKQGGGRSLSSYSHIFWFFTEICGVIDKWILKKDIKFSKI